MIHLAFTIALACNAFGDCNYAPLVKEEFKTVKECQEFRAQVIKGRFDAVLEDCIGTEEKSK